MAKNLYNLSEDDVVIQLEPFAEWKRQEDCKELHFDSHTINRAIEAKPRSTIKKLSKLAGLPVPKIIEHVQHFMGLQTPKLGIERLMLVQR